MKIAAVARVASGNFLEMYDFMVFGYYAAAIARAFFPAHSDFASLMLSLMTFGAGFLMRPLGAIFLGAYIDHHGRRAGLLLTLGLMSLGTLSIALTPSYAAIGLLAPLIVVSGRLLQGFSAGAELGGVSVYLAEIATPGHKGFYVSWQSASQQLAVIFAALLGVALTALLTAEQMARFGWRVPLWIGCAIVPLLLMLRRLRPLHIAPELLRSKLEAKAKVGVVDLLRFEGDPEGVAGIPGAMRIDPLELKRKKQIVVPPGVDLVLYCRSRNSFVSARVVTALRKRGIHNIHILAGGLEAWRSLGFPLTGEFPEPEAEMKRLGIGVWPPMRTLHEQINSRGVSE